MKLRYLSALALLAIAFFVYQQKCNPIENTATIDNAKIVEQTMAQATIAHTPEGTQVYTKPVVIANNLSQIIKALNDAKTNYSTDTATQNELRHQIEYLQSIISNQKGTIESLATIQQKTVITAKAPITNDTATKTKIVHFYNDDEWYDITVITTKEDSALLSAIMLNRFGIVQYTEGGQSYVKVINQNPYTTTEPGTNIFKINPLPKRQKRFGVGVQVGYGVNSLWQVKPQVGIGVQYNFLNF